VDPALGGAATGVRVALALAMILAAVRAFVVRPRTSMLLSAAAACALLPVAGMGINVNSTSGGRLLYWPGVFVSLLYAIGVTAASRSRRWHPVQWGGIAAIGLGIMASGTYQARLWSAAEALARRCMDQLAQRPSTGHVHVTNLPCQLVGGPYVLKAYAPGYYYGDTYPLVRATRVLVSYEGGRFEEVTRDDDPFSQYDAAADEHAVTLAWHGGSRHHGMDSPRWRAARTSTMEP